jgi:hypothetical protein
MNAGPDRTSGSSSSLSERPSGPIDRRQPKAIQLLLPVWGTNYIRQFLEVGLPTLLAPGNLPALAEALPCKLVILTNAEGADLLRPYPGIRYLQSICEIEFRFIDELITGDNYSTTITLAYAKAVQAAGDAMLDTCFFFLISDYIIADGSLRNVLARIFEGYNGVFAGNFQVTREDAHDSFFRQLDEGKPAIVVPPRRLTEWAFRFLHPMTAANTVNFSLCHSAHSNRLFWRVNETTLIGRFYLMHMICIRPEITDFVIGSSCDYSFMPEMCPSDNVHVMTDSDEYLVVEMQGRTHEREFLRLGAVNLDSLVESLAEWTTARHRENAHSVVVFHVGKGSPELAEVVAESKTYIEAIERRLPAAQPHRNHPYWIGAINAHLAARKPKQESSDIDLEGIQTKTNGYQALLYRGRDLIFGRIPNVRRIHPRWADYKTVVDLARRYFSVGQRRLLIVSESPGAFQSWFSDLASSVTSFDGHRLSVLDRDEYAKLQSPFDGCLLVLRQDELQGARAAIARISPVLSSDASIVVFVTNTQGVGGGHYLGTDILHNIDRFFDLSVVLEKVAFVPSNSLSWLAYRSMRNAFVLTLKRRLYLPVAAATAGVFVLVTFAANLFRRKSSDEPTIGGLYSSIIMVLHPTGAQIAEAESTEERYLKLAAQRFTEDSLRVNHVGRAGKRVWARRDERSGNSHRA